MTTKPDIATGVYRHFKGGLYQVIGLVRHSETDDWLVLYYPLYGDAGEDNLWVRPLTMFFEMVDAADGQMPRFCLQQSTI